MKPPDESEPRNAPGGRRPPEYVVVVNASDWVKEHFPAARANRTTTRNPTWKPNHDPDRR